MGNVIDKEGPEKRQEYIRQARLLSKFLLANNPVELDYICPHNHCKKVADLLIETTETGKHSFYVGEIMAGGGFSKFHPNSLQAEWTNAKLTLRGSLDDYSSVVELEYRAVDLIVGVFSTISTNGDSVMYPIHAHPTNGSRIHSLLTENSQEINI